MKDRQRRHLDAQSDHANNDGLDQAQVGEIGAGGGGPETDGQTGEAGLGVSKQALEATNADGEAASGGVMTKFIIYAEKEEINGLAEFYRDIIGLTPIGYLNPGWNHFDTGNGRLCMHHNNLYRGTIAGPRHSHIVIAKGKTRRDIENMHAAICAAGYRVLKDDPEDMTKKVPMKQKEISPVWTGKDGKSGKDTYTFWLLDPVGNMVQIESE